MRFISAFIAASVLACAGAPAFADDSPLDARVETLAHEWAHLNYEVKGDARAAEADKAMAMANAAVKDFPGRAEPLVWDAIITSTAGGIRGGLGALGLVKDAKAMLEKAEKIDPTALKDGSIYTSLGSLYYQVPGFPIGFGDKDKARAYLQRAVAVNPSGIDPNYFYGDFLLQQHEYGAAAAALQKAVDAPPRVSREVADHGRHAEATALLATAKAHLPGHS
jgi:tetratricopeptide (TPR) repeat protein